MQLRQNKGASFALFACILSLLFGVAEVGKPLDQFMQAVRFKIRAQDASQKIVLVGIDSRSLYEGSHWPWSRSRFASTIDELNSLGAGRIFLALDLSSQGDPADDQSLANAIARSKAPVFLQARFSIDNTTRKRIDQLPAAQFREHAQMVSGAIWKDGFGSSWTLPYATVLAGEVVPSLSAKLANASGRTRQSYAVDYSTNPRSVPVVSAIDVLKNRVDRALIAGKDIVVAPNATEIEQSRSLPGFGLHAKSLVHIIGAETLIKGRPVSLGWMPGWCLAMAVLLLSMTKLNSTIRRSAFALAAIGLFAIPLFLEAFLVNVDVVTGLFVLCLLAGNKIWMKFRAALHRQGLTNVVSGLRNLNALRELEIRPSTILVLANVRNFASIRSALESEKERELVEEIVKRLTVGSQGLELYQGDDGVFVWLLDRNRSGDVGDHVEAIHSFFRSPLIVGGRAIQLNVTFGVDEDDARSIPNRMGTALVASHEAERSGRRWLMSDAQKSKDVEWKLDLIARLDSAISNGELWVAYQPKLDLKTGRISGAEALVRWSHPERGLLPPDEFISLAEEQNCIGNLTAFVLSNAIQVAARINAGGIPFNIAVNLSPRVVDGVAIDLMAQGLLDRYGLPPSRLVLEVTETAAMASGDEFLSLLHRLRAMGTNISVDDYGSGLSTLGYIRTIPASEIKIDRAFITNIATSEEDQVMVRSTVQMAHSLGRTIVAEGVETQEGLECVARLGCDVAQGYHIGRPVPVRQLFRAVLKDGLRRAA